jgi:hypothetical protein
MAFSTFNSFHASKGKFKISSKNPTSITGLQLWLDATDNSSLVLSGSSLSQWNDKSGNGRNATKFGSSATNAVYNATGFNNFPAIQMGTGQGLSVPMLNGTIVSGITVLVIFQKNGTANSYETIVTRDSGAIASPFNVYNLDRFQGNGSAHANTTSAFNLQTATGLNIF